MQGTEQGGEEVVVALTFERQHLESIARQYAMLRQEPSLPISTADLRAALDSDAPVEGEAQEQVPEANPLWPNELRMAAIVWEVQGASGADIFVAEDPPGEFEDEAVYVRADVLHSTTKDPEEGDDR